MKKIIPWLFLIIGIVLVLPLIGVSQLGVAAEWIVAIAFLLVGIIKVLPAKA